MKVLRLTVSRVEVVYSLMVIVTAAIAFLPREINTGVYLFLFVLTLPVSIVAMVTVFMIGGPFLPLEGNIGSSVSAILIWVTLSALQMRVILLVLRHWREQREMRLS